MNRDLFWLTDEQFSNLVVLGDLLCKEPEHVTQAIETLQIVVGCAAPGSARQ